MERDWKSCLSAAKRELAKHGIGCDGKRAVQLKKSDYDKYDYFICMDSDNIRNTMRIFGDDKDGKVCKMMSFAGMNRDVSDPWYSGDFEQAYNDIYSGCKGLLKIQRQSLILLLICTKIFDCICAKSKTHLIDTINKRC